MVTNGRSIFLYKASIFHCHCSKTSAHDYIISSKIIVLVSGGTDGGCIGITVYVIVYNHINQAYKGLLYDL